MDRTLFEVSWEVANKVGGIHTVLATKAPSLVERLGDRYLAIGPLLLGEERGLPGFEEESGFEDLCGACRAAGLETRIGRWLIPGRPRCVQVGFSGLYEQKDRILARLWERYKVDSLEGGWDYVEPLLFGYAAGMFIEHWWHERIEPRGGGAVAQFHEWLSGSGLLYLKTHLPQVGTVFTTHATVLGRALCSSGSPLREALGERAPAAAARAVGVGAKHSLEGVAARQADVFTTVSSLTAEEAALLHLREPTPLTLNGVDLGVVEAAAAGVGRKEARERLREIAAAFLGDLPEDPALLVTSGRYEFRNKGFDLLLEALAELEDRPGRPLLLFVLVPSGHSGPRKDLLDRLGGRTPADGPLPGLSTHSLFDTENDSFHLEAARLGLDNRPGRRVHLIQIPVYLDGGDGLVDLPYEAVMRAMDLGCFPSFYEPWGYTPVEALALGVPTLTSDRAGFGCWVREQGLDPADGVSVLAREGVEDAAAIPALADLIETILAAPPSPARCRRSATRLSWKDFLGAYEEAWGEAANLAEARREQGFEAPPRPVVPLPVKSTALERQPHLLRFDVAASLPPELAGLEELSRNLWWCWDSEAPTLFEELSPQGWERCAHNPVRLLRQVYAADLAERAADPDYVERVKRTLQRFQAAMAEGTRSLELTEGRSLDAQHPVAYFCFEYGLHESVPIYSGGLGVLAGDHLKSASDLRLPLVALGLFFRGGYFRQELGADGAQIALPEDLDPRELPLEAVRGPDGRPLEIGIRLPGRRLILRAWELRVGRVPLYLLDSDSEANRPEDRSLTHRLYGGDRELRLIQEMILGRGGIQLLDALGLEARALHLNEGHAAFAPLERIASLMRRSGWTFEEAHERVRATCAFTTHTPVPAGHDVFDEDLMRRYFADVPEWLGIPWERFLALGASNPPPSFNMSHLACSCAAVVNGVSELHGRVSRELLNPVWPGLLANEVPVQHITNGVHLPSWTAPALGRLLGVEQRSVRGDDFRRAREVLAPALLWKERCRLKAKLLAEVARRVEQNFLARQESPRLMSQILENLDPRAMVIGFARRFAPYKRAMLLFRDPERLQRLLGDPERPLLLLFAGKAHPADQAGQALLRELVELSRGPGFAGKVIFLEGYDLALARRLVQGVDVWLNNPTRPLEASGTSGMKAAANGALNLSVLDGWWPEGFDGENGWSLAAERAYPDQALQDEHDNARLLNLLEQEILPLFFERDADGLPHGWLQRVMHSLESIPPVFDSTRMVEQYRDHAYLPLARADAALEADPEGLRERATRHASRRRAFREVRVRTATSSPLEGLHAGSRIEVEAEVELGGLSPREVLVELVIGHLDDGERLRLPQVIPLELVGSSGDSTTFRGGHEVDRSGSYGYGIRVRARPLDERDLDSLRLIVWA